MPIYNKNSNPLLEIKMKLSLIKLSCYNIMQYWEILKIHLFTLKQSDIIFFGAKCLFY